MIRSTSIVRLQPAYLKDGEIERYLNVNILAVVLAEDVNIAPVVILIDNMSAV